VRSRPHGEAESPWFGQRIVFRRNAWLLEIFVIALRSPSC
jgi:hypothetical protein